MTATFSSEDALASFEEVTSRTVSERSGFISCLPIAFAAAGLIVVLSGQAGVLDKRSVQAANATDPIVTGSTSVVGSIAAISSK